MNWTEIDIAAAHQAVFSVAADAGTQLLQAIQAALNCTPNSEPQCAIVCEARDPAKETP